MNKPTIPQHIIERATELLTPEVLSKDEAKSQIENSVQCGMTLAAEAIINALIENKAQELQDLVTRWRQSADDFTTIIRLGESAPHQSLRNDAEVNRGWQKCLLSCVSDLEEIIKKQGTASKVRL